MIGYALLLPWLEIALKGAGYRRLRAWLARHPRRVAVFEGSELEALEEARRTGRLVRLAAEHGPWRATCLRQALLTWWLLRRQGIQSELRIGVQRREGRLLAHAWVRRGEAVITEGEETEAHFRAFEGLSEE